jgi:hypothetical protein
MTNKQIWFITGAGRGMGVDIAKAALAAGHAVVATGRDPERVSATLGTHDDLLTVKLDVTSLDDAKDAARAAVERFGRIDVLINNAGNFYAGFFEEITPEDFRAQVETTMFGPMNVTRAVLPVMRTQRSGLVVADLIDRRRRGSGVLLGLCRLKVRGAAALRGRRRRRGDHCEEGTRSHRPGGRQSRAVQQPRPRRRLSLATDSLQFVSVSGHLHPPLSSIARSRQRHRKKAQDPALLPSTYSIVGMPSPKLSNIAAICFSRRLMR